MTQTQMTETISVPSIVDPASIYSALWQDTTVAYAILAAGEGAQSFRFLAMNDAIAQLGFLPTEAEALGKSLNIVFPAQVAVTLQQHCLECVRSQKVIEFKASWSVDQSDENHWQIKLHPLCVAVDAAANELNGRAADRQIMLVATDITDAVRELDQIKTDLAATKADAQTIFDHVQGAISLHELTGEMIDINQQALDMHDITREEALSYRIDKEFARPETPVHLLPELWERALNEEQVTIEWPAKRASDGKPLVLSVVLQRVVLGGRDLIMACARDITERKEIEAEQNRLLEIIDSTPDLVGMADAEGNNFYLNRAGRKILEIDESGSVEFHINEKMSQRQQALFYSETLPKLLEEGSWSGESLLLSPTGEDLPVSQVVLAHKDESGEIAYISTIVRDIHEIKETEAKLRDREQFLNSIYMGADIVIFAWDWVGNNNEFRCSGWNPNCEAATGLSAEQVLGKTPDEVFGPDQGMKVTQNVGRCVATRRPISYEEELVLDGTSTWWATKINPIENSKGEIYRVVGTTTNITKTKLNTMELEAYSQRQAAQAKALTVALEELKQTQAHIVQSEKMSSLGQMVAGIAHEINNPVNFIHANIKPASAYAGDLIEMVKAYQQEYTEPSDELLELLEDLDFEFIQTDFLELLNSMKTGTQRIREIVLSLRNFSRLDEADVKSANIHEGIDSTLVILAHRLREYADQSTGRQPIEVVKDYQLQFLVECYPSQLNQVVLNIVANAIDALASVEQPKITVSTRLCTEKVCVEKTCTENICSTCTEPADAVSSCSVLADALMPDVPVPEETHDFAVIVIADNGPGMPVAVQERIFDPFFTTKAVGKGTGMGLSISYKIVTEKHGGELSVSSTPGQGTEFVIKLPLTQAAYRLDVAE